MKNTIKLVSVLVVIIIVSVTSLITQHNKQSKTNDVAKEKSDQEKAEELAEKMKPKIEECLRKEDIHHFIKTITFKERVTINPMGYIVIRGYINDEPEKYEFSASLKYRTKEIGSMSYSAELGDRFENWDDFDPQVKEDYLNSLSKKEREQYLKDIGEKV
ncbi:DUF1433 domain-containing protein [Bacillus altitudinis MN12]|uniref:DUF1433 domain-containing protein n=1 Tax=Bacillus aerius TaxID=293388 RepID=A0ABR6AX25_9BACI|nr:MULTISPECIES: DUF1433 domain-containing protein [Bacillus]MBW3701060.1 DUF1433 domain-containing protein [Bacillus aerophilus]MCA1014870.1 DUF1433 domain-containing protein [Bacillus stratosphericus]MBA8916429.1 hypothetical protein [Bacillus aerius]MBR0584316.1 DUF1433 domain-containing protein [Bacillus altitudinis MN12]MBR0594887.1 DUF1433 domain-containing protein [Bacillus altitudinis C16B11]